MMGLLKIGKTTKSPDKRMAELHSTGVPTPFVLEFSAKVDNCSISEKNAHEALEKYRISKSREFFRIGVRDALLILLPVIEDYEIHYVSSLNGIDKIEEIVRKKLKAKERREKQQQEIFNERVEQRRIKREAEIKNISEALELENKKHRELGSRPIEYRPNIIEEWMPLLFIPIPIGCIFWVGAFQVFSHKNQEYGVFCIVILFIGYFFYKVDSERSKEYNKRLRPFLDTEAKISIYKKEIEKFTGEK